jgi:dGTPase
MVHEDYFTSPGLQTVGQREAMLLAPYAMRSADSRGRKYPESGHPYRGPFQRDRDRIVHSSAYRRLSGKMQVFTGEMGDYHRTRLTHTHEVASIARTIGRALRLNEDLIEALALFHDIGHPPFGHAGEDALNQCLADHGGFSHNRYALVIAEQLESRYQSFPGLNLTHEVLESQASRIEKAAGGPAPLLEAQVVEVADSMTYDAHDTDDAVKLGLVSLDELAEISLVGETIRRVHERFGGLRGKLLRKAVVHELIDHQVTDVLQTTGPALSRCGFRTPDQARRTDFRIGPSPRGGRSQGRTGSLPVPARLPSSATGRRPLASPTATADHVHRLLPPPGPAAAEVPGPGRSHRHRPSRRRLPGRYDRPLLRTAIPTPFLTECRSVRASKKSDGDLPIFEQDRRG